MKKRFFTTAGISTLALMFSVAPALAANVSLQSENNTTGADSYNDNRFDVDNDIDVRVNNRGNVKNRAYAHVNTGFNVQHRNLEAGRIDTGDIDASALWENVLNDGVGVLGMGDGEVDIDVDFSNRNTGADSRNENRLNFDNEIDVRLSNIAYVLNRLGLHANTGHNVQARNLEAGDIRTGDIDFDSTIRNYANNDSGLGGLVGGLAADISAENRNTGSDSRNRNRIDIDNDVDVRVSNRAYLDTQVKVYANTGHNEQSRNNEAGDIRTGNVGVDTRVTNSANNGGALGGTGSGGLELSADLSNRNTGADSRNENRLNVDNQVNVNVNNQANVNTNLSVNANTGHNEQSRNLEAGDIRTGDAEVNFSVFNTVNSN